MALDTLLRPVVESFAQATAKAGMARLESLAGSSPADTRRTLGRRRASRQVLRCSPRHFQPSLRSDDVSGCVGIDPEIMLKLIIPKGFFISCIGRSHPALVENHADFVWMGKFGRTLS